MSKPLLLCPVCGSAKLYYEMGGYTGTIYHCKECDYVGPLAVEGDEELAKAIHENYLKPKTED